MSEYKFQSIDSVAQIDPAFLSGLLDTKYPGAVVTSVTIGRVINGTATKVRLLLEYDEKTLTAYRLPPTMWLKAGLEMHSVKPEMKEVYIGEARYYRDIADLLELGPPRAFAAEVNEATGQSYILLEDLLALHVTFGHSLKPATPDDAARMLGLLARLHAKYWGSDALNKFSWLGDGGAFARSRVHDWTFDPAHWNRCKSLPRGELMVGVLGERETMHAIVRGLLQDDIRNAHCLVHGDAQLMNLYFHPDGTPGLLDWQNAMLGFWAHDVTEYLVTALTIEDRRTHERGLIRHYVEELRKHGVESLDDSEAWYEYRRHTAYTFHWLLCLPEWQPEEICRQNSERAIAAIVDHESINIAISSANRSS